MRAVVRVGLSRSLQQVVPSGAAVDAAPDVVWGHRPRVAARATRGVELGRDGAVDVSASAAANDELAQIELRTSSKRFGRVRALDGVSLAVRRGSVHALIGENGAGKSTLGKIIAGAYTADGGGILLDGAPVLFHSPREALERGIATIAQEPCSSRGSRSRRTSCWVRSHRRRASSGGVRCRSDYRRVATTAGFELSGELPAGRCGSQSNSRSRSSGPSRATRR